MKAQTVLACALMVASFLMAGCSGSGGTGGTTSGPKVELKNIEFTPKELSVKKGTTVTWENMEGVTHTVTKDGATGPDSPSLNKGGKYTFTFTEAGTFSYHCKIVGHAQQNNGTWTGMVGTITVTA